MMCKRPMYGSNVNQLLASEFEEPPRTQTPRHFLALRETRPSLVTDDMNGFLWFVEVKISA